MQFRRRIYAALFDANRNALPAMTVFDRFTRKQTAAGPSQFEHNAENPRSFFSP